MEKIVSGPRSISAEAKERHQTPSSSSSSSSFAASPHSFEGNATSSIDNNNGSEKAKMVKEENIMTRQLPLRQSIRSNRGVPSARMLNQDELFQQLIIDAASSDSSSSSSPSSSTTTPAPNKKRLRDRRGEQENANEEDEEEEAPAKEEEEDDEGERNERKKATKHASSSMISKTGGLLGKRSRTSNTSTAPPSQPNDHGRISIIRNRLTNGLLKAIRQQLHGPPPSGKKPYSKYEEGMNEKTALQLMNGYDDYQTSDTKKSIRWLFYDSDKITEFLALPNNNNIISNVPYGGWVRVRKGQPTPSILKDAEFEALEVRYDRERNLFVLTSRTRLYYNENDAYYKWPVPGKLHFNPPH